MNERALSLRTGIQRGAVVADGVAPANIGSVAGVEETTNVRLAIVNTGAQPFQGGRVQATCFAVDAADAYWDDIAVGAGIIALAPNAKFSEVYQGKAYRFMRVQAFAAGGSTADVAWTGA